MVKKRKTYKVKCIIEASGLKRITYLKKGTKKLCRDYIYTIAKRALTISKKQNIKYRNLQHFIGFTIVDKGEAMFLRVRGHKTLDKGY